MFVCPQRIQGTRQVCKERSQSLLYSNYVWSLRRVARCYVETRLGVLACESDAAPSATTLMRHNYPDSMQYVILRAIAP